MANPENLKPFKKGDDERRWTEGRPKKFTTLMKENGYKLAEVNDSIQAIMAMNEEQIKEVLENDDATMLEKTVAKAIIKSFEKGSLYSMDTPISCIWQTQRTD